jgi:hypothetical protein
MKTLWFVHRDGAVFGPFSSDDIENGIADGSFGPTCLIWARGTHEWSPIIQWKQLAQKIEASQKAADNRVWYCDSGAGHPIGPLTQSELAEHLRGLNRWDIVTVWGTGLLKWLPLFEVPEVMDLVGISRREKPRVPLLGQIAMTTVGSQVPAQLLPSLSISVGGLGVKNAGGFNRGDKVQIAIKSQDISGTIHALGEVLYVSRMGDAGIRFLDISPDHAKLIAKHVQLFQTNGSLAA